MLLNMVELFKSTSTLTAWQQGKAMKDYDFTLKFDLPDHDADPEHFVEVLYESGCDDASVGIGQHGRIALNFIRQSESSLDAVSSAISDVKRAIPGAKLIEATPDLVGLQQFIQ